MLFLRLHLLQGVVAFHQGKTLEATRLLQQAKEELERLTLDDNDLSQLANLGYSLSDARLGLRAHRGDLNAACQYLQRRDEERKEQERKEKEEEELIRERKRLGRTVGGQWVNMGYLKTIVNMGYERSSAVKALQRTNNDINKSLEYIQSDMEASLMDVDSFYSEESLVQVMSINLKVFESVY